VLDLSLTTVRYEDVVADLDTTVASVLDFLGVAWDDSLRDHASAAEQRGRITTPSYVEVTQPVHGRARERWRRYGDHLAPVMEHLAPWARHYGYAAQ